MMIEKICINNYKSIQSLQDFELKPVNVLIGANNSGKSNFLDVFAFLRDTLQENDFQSNGKTANSGWYQALLSRGGSDAVCFNNARYFQISCVSHPFKYSLKVVTESSTQFPQITDEQLTDVVNGKEILFEPQFRKMLTREEDEKFYGSNAVSQQTELAKLLRANRADEQVLNFAKRLSEIRIYDRLRTEKWAPIRAPQKSKGELLLEEDGGNLVGVLHQLSETYPTFRRELDSLLRILFRDFSRISFPSNEQGELYIRWEDKNGRVLNTSQISDGTLKFLCLIAILKNPNPPALIGLDEPDAKLHPMMQVILDGMIDEAARRTQIIATTHNPDFVSSFTPEEIVILQQYHGATEMRRFSSKGALELWLQDFSTRELWLMGELESRW
jgi:predicted ATPase